MCTYRKLKQSFTKGYDTSANTLNKGLGIFNNKITCVFERDKIKLENVSFSKMKRKQS